MNSSDNQQLADELIGEALLFLLKENGPINTLALIARLQQMESSEQDNQRRALLVRLIDEISSNKIASSRVQNGDEQDENTRDAGDNVYPLFGNRQRQGRSRKQ
ncbi:hypothetical protein SAMN05216563_104186 [Phytobacter palmae]|uniref:Uncharacterized protein n=1 Tax=Phytobacter palmae TaxID=1855371 RepID=A0ABU9V0F5_9ENTR|nr:hypothetical protein [Escherichia coli]SFE27457.1 hypothetical protein SAMN05216563_104186 [Phytobacter palmae]